MNKKMFIVMISMLAVFFLAAQTCQMQGVTTGIARDCVGENDIVCDDTEAYQCQLAQFGVGYYVTRAPGFDVECGGESTGSDVPVCINRVKDGRETDVDCGGPDCRGCLDGFTCTLDRDCAPYLMCDSTTKVCVEDPTVDLRCTATDLTNCDNFECNGNLCYTSCTASDAECASGYACSTSLSECLEDADGDGFADVEETTTAPTCTETDSGNQVGVAGSTTDATAIYTDQCYTYSTLTYTASDTGAYIKEYYCSNNGITSTGVVLCSSYNSLFGTSYTGCESGACVSSGTANTAETCTDTDGGKNYIQQGTVSGGTWYYTGAAYTSSTDECGGNGKLYEKYCLDSTQASGYYYSCESVLGEGYVCESGACVSSGTTEHSCATDDVSDCEEGYACLSSTACYTSCTVSEYSGSSTGCSEGYTCFAGSCVAETTTTDYCTETDGGYDIYETGTTTKGTSTYTDSCSSGKLTEYWCSNDEIKSSSGLNCAITAFPVCYQGACVEECGIDTDCDPGESCDSSTHTCEEEDHSYLYSKLNNDDYIKFKLADLSSGHYTTSRLGYLTSLTLEGIDYTTSAIAHVSVDNSGGDNYFDFTSSSTPRYINFEDTIEKPEHWLYVSADVKVDVTSLNSNQIILAQLTKTAGSQLYALLTKNGKYVFKISVDDTVYEVECSGYGPDTTWQEVIGLYTGDTIQIFVGGHFCGQSPASGAISSPYSNGDFVIGYSTLTSGGMQFKGYIDDIYIFGE